MGDNEDFRPKWMEDVAKAGGWEEHAKLEAQKELLDKLIKIPTEKFTNLSKMVSSLENMFDRGGSNVDVLQEWKNDIMETFQTELEALLSPLKNEITAVINTMLEPFLPMIKGGVDAISTLIQRGMGAIQALIEGKFGEWFRQQQLQAQEEGWIQRIRQRYGDLYWGGPGGRARINTWLQRYGFTLEELETEQPLTIHEYDSLLVGITPEEIQRLMDEYYANLDLG